MLGVVFVVASIAGASPTPSPTPSPSPPPVIGSVRVATGTLESLHRLPLPASLLTNDQIRANPAVTSDELLRALPGFDRNRSNNAFTNYGQLRVSFAGAGTDRGVVLVDGVPAQDAFGGQVDWAAYPASDVTRVELLRGPGSALYGSGAIGGVLSLNTFAPTTELTGAAQGDLQFSAGTHALVNNYIQTTTAVSPKISLSASGSQQQLQYFTLPPAYQTGINHIAVAQDDMASVKLRYAPSSSTVFEYGYRGAWDYQQEGRTNYDFWRNLIQNALQFAHASKTGSIGATVYARNTFVTNRADKSTAPGALLYTQYVPTHENGVIANWTVDSETSTFEVRADERYVTGESDQYNAANLLTASGSGTQQLADLALQNTWRFRRGEAVAGVADSAIYLPRASLTSGGKTRAVAPNTSRSLSPRAALRYDVTSNLAFRVSGGTGFRAPYVNELVRGYVIGPVSYLPNPNLVPERSSSLSAGLDWTAGSNELSADFVETYVTDAIDFRTIDPTHQVRSNFAHAQTDGTTVSYTRRLGACSTLSAWGTAQVARITGGSPATIGKQLPYVPQSSAYAGYDTLLGATHVGVNVAYIGPTYADDLNLQALGTAVTAGAFASIPVGGGARIIVRGDNITSAHYLSSIDRYGPPAVVSIGVSLPVNKQAPARCAGATD